MFQTKVVDKNQNIFYVQQRFFFENPAIYDITWKNIVAAVRSQMTIWCIRITCWISKATTHSQYVIHFAIPRQK